MGLIAAFLPNPTHLQRLRSAMRDRHSVVGCDDWGALTQACDAQPVQLAVVDLYADGAAGFERIRVLRQRFPKLGLIAYVTSGAAKPRDMFDAGRVGIDGLVLAELDDAPPAMLALIEQAEARGVTAMLRASLGELRPKVRDAVLVVVTRAHERLTPAGLARVLALPKRVLAKWLAEASFPPPHQLITWGRLIVAAHMLGDRMRSVDGVANALDFPSGSAFRNSCQRYLGATPMEVRERGGADFVIRCFAERAAKRAEGGAPRARTRATSSATRSPMALL